MRSKSIPGYYLIALLLLPLPLDLSASNGKIAQLTKEKTKIEAETETARQTSEESRVRLERLKQKLAELYEINQHLDAEIKAATEKAAGFRQE
ncbi:MAG: hypothetical protein RPU52_05020 [Candidatus Sedimenticola sp. (ex Thyasira tokunagai)]